MQKTWKARTRDGQEAPEELASQIAKGCGVSLRMARLLWLRGVDSPAEGNVYLDPRLRYLSSPRLWHGMAEAAGEIDRRLAEGGRLAIWGDYDVDGITGTALALEVLRYHGISASWHIPDRRTEGYGMNEAGVEALARQGIDILLTVDCGISDEKAIARARELGMTVIVTDHHIPPQLLPPATVICNPKVGGGPCLSLSGVGVIFYVMAELNALLARRNGKKMDMRSVLDLVALGTLADLVELEGQNRILVQNGLKILADARRPGISELKAVCGFSPAAALGAGQVVFSLAPRINAAGRMASAQTALDLLLSTDFDACRRLSTMLDGYNSLRRQEEDKICEAAMLEAEQLPDDPAYVIAGDDWNQGVIGIVASRIVEKFNKPAFVLCRDGACLKGSGRSIEGFDLHAGLELCANDLVGYGGHRMAAGIRVMPEKLEDFRRHFCEAVRGSLGSAPVPPVQYIDAELDFSGASNFAFLKELGLLQPFGVGNPEPVFSVHSLIIKKIRTFGIKKNHALLELADESCGITLRAKAWRGADRFTSGMEGSRIDLAYTPSIDMYNGVASVDIKIKDWRPANV
ncbi:MAG: single-stranded-DNA-specific exonuclease RecJ [Mailhella sp.]|nr:single-stranded-DNA-specific exonuclease RecJ [Mailhella sp.]